MQILIAPTIIAFVIAVASGPIIIPLMQKMKFGQVIREDGPESHLSKKNTPTMGGIIMVISVGLTCLIMIRVYDPHVFMAFFTFIAYAIVGLMDDLLKITRKNTAGLKARYKIICQVIISAVVALYAYQHIGTKIMVPFIDKTWDIGVWIIPIVMFVMVAATNAVNLTDGLDGLASGVSLVYFATFTLIFASGLVPSGDNLVIMSAALAGGCLGFLFFNRYPARIFMGDTGSLALGGMVAYMCVVSRTILWLPIMGIMFVMSALSVVIQVISYKSTGKRVFKMAPLHHHYEVKGYHETTIVIMYTIITLTACMIGLLAF